MKLLILTRLKKLIEKYEGDDKERAVLKKIRDIFIPISHHN